MKPKAIRFFPLFYLVPLAYFLVTSDLWVFFLLWTVSIHLLEKMTKKSPPWKAIHWAHALTFDLFAVIGIFLSALFPLSKKNKENGYPILLVHGYLNGERVWRLHKKWLLKAGLGPIYTIDLSSSFQPIEEQAKEIEEALAKIPGKALLVGYSMGGLGCLWCALQKGEKVRSVITIGSPLKGSKLAYVAIGTSAKQMRPNSSFLGKLQKLLEKQSSFPIYHIGSRTDTLIHPYFSAFLEKNPSLLLDGIGHGAMLYSREIAKQIEIWAKKDPAIDVGIS